MKFAFVLLAVASSAPAQPPVAVTNSPPPRIVSVPADPAFPSVIVIPPAQVTGPRSASLRRYIIRPAQPRRPVQAYIARDDYPASALAQRAHGWVAFTLRVGVDGRVHQCAVTSSSGSSALDSTTCSIMRRRARFTPAIDSTGNPAPWTASGEVEWRLP